METNEEVQDEPDRRVDFKDQQGDLCQPVIHEQKDHDAVPHRKSKAVDPVEEKERSGRNAFRSGFAENKSVQGIRHHESDESDGENNDERPDLCLPFP